MNASWRVVHIGYAYANLMRAKPVFPHQKGEKTFVLHLRTDPQLNRPGFRYVYCVNPKWNWGRWN